jgi:hypothetical protein
VELAVHKHIIHHHNGHNQGLGLKTCSFKAQSVLGVSIFVSVFPYPAAGLGGIKRNVSILQLYKLSSN